MIPSLKVIVQQDKTKMQMEIYYTPLEDFDFDINDFLADITYDKYMLSNINSKILFYDFNNYQNIIGEEIQKIRHTNIADDGYALKNLQSKNWLYFIERIIEIFVGDILSSPLGTSNNEFNGVKTFNDSRDNLSICKEYYNQIYTNIGTSFPNLQKRYLMH